MESNLVNQSYFKFIYLANTYSFPEHVYKNKTESTILTGRHPIKNEKKVAFYQETNFVSWHTVFSTVRFSEEEKGLCDTPTAGDTV